MSKQTKAKILRMSATAICVVAPLFTTCMYFPLWVSQSGEATVSGMFAVAAFLSCLPFVKQIRAYMKSPSAWFVWLMIFVSLFALKEIIQQMIVVSAVGFAANIVGTGLFALANSIYPKEGETNG